MCPRFDKERKHFFEKVHETVANLHLTGCVQLDGEEARGYKERKKTVEYRFKHERTEDHIAQVLASITLTQILTGVFKKAVLPLEGYQQISYFLGHFLTVVETETRRFYEKNRGSVNQRVNGDLVDADSDG